jgi:hypothetical protein
MEKSGMKVFVGLKKNQSGVVLFVSLIMLIVITMISMSLMSMSGIEMRMANNEEARINGLQVAQAIVDVVASQDDVTPVIGAAGYTLCAGNSDDACDVYVDDKLPDNQVKTEVDEGSLQLMIIRTEPALQPPPRGTKWSIKSFDAAPFRVRGIYDRTEEGGGYAAVEQGVEIMIIKSL